MDILQRLVGQKVIRTEQSGGTATVVFSGAVLAAYNPLDGAVSGEAQGLTVTSAHIVDGREFVLGFSGGARLSVSLLEKHYLGPEAFSVRFSDGTIVVAP